jgi:Leucine-rich repeat (LRR) protein
METTSAQRIGQPRRRWFQLGLRTLLGLVTMTAIWLGALVNRAERQRRAVAAVQHLGGEVAYSDEGLSWSPEWLRAWAREGYFQKVTAVSLTQITDADLTHLEDLTGLQRLWLHDTQVSDAGLEHLNGLNSIQDLDLSNTRVSDGGLKQLKGMSSLQRLWLINTHVSNEGIAELRAALPNCNIEANMPTVTVP